MLEFLPSSLSKVRTKEEGDEGTNSGLSLVMPAELDTEAEVTERGTQRTPIAVAKASSLHCKRVTLKTALGKQAAAGIAPAEQTQLEWRMTPQQKLSGKCQIPRKNFRWRTRRTRLRNMLQI